MQERVIKNTIKGHHLPSPRPTFYGIWSVFCYAILPFITVLLGLDALLYLIFRYGFDHCYGVFCFF